MDKDKVSKESYENLLNREKRLQRILEKTQYGFFIIGEDKKFIDANDSYCKMSGYTREELLNLKLSDIDFFENSEENKKTKEELMNKGKATLETMHVKKTGEVFDVEVSISLINHDPVEALCFCRDITDKKKDQQKILEMKKRLENIIEGTNVGTWEWNIKEDSTIVNKKYAEMLGYKLDEINPMNIEKWENLIHHDDSKKYEKMISKLWNKKMEYYDIEVRVKHKNGKWKWINSRGKVTKWSEDGSPVIMSGTHIDITEKKEKEQKILKMKKRLENIIEGTNAGTWERNLITGNAIIDEKWAEMIGYKLKELLPMNKKIWQSLIFSQDLEKVEKNISKLINKEIEYYDVEFRMKHKNGMCIWVNGRGKISQYSKDGKPILISGTTINITEKKEKEKEIEYLSFHDTLTGLYNRRYMEDSIKRLDTDRNIPFSIIAVDVDGLKLINDTFGHKKGDKLLIKAADILKRSCRKEDIVCRVSGDEFVILLPNIDDMKVQEIVERIKEESENANLEPIIISLSAGYSTKNKKEQDIKETYKEADNNMYNSKSRNGRIMRIKTIEKALSKLNTICDNQKDHSQRVSDYCESIAKALNLSSKEVEDVRIAGTFHDIGKVAVPEDILKKENKLKVEELEEFKKHPFKSYQLLKSVDDYAHLAEAVLHHHERLDGSGYEGLKEDEIPFLSKIIAVADYYETMTAKKSYHKKDIKEELKKYAGIHFDREIVDVFVNKVL